MMWVQTFSPKKLVDFAMAKEMLPERTHATSSWIKPSDLRVLESGALGMAIANSVSIDWLWAHTDEENEKRVW